MNQRYCFLRVRLDVHFLLFNVIRRQNDLREEERTGFKFQKIVFYDCHKFQFQFYKKTVSLDIFVNFVELKMFIFERVS